MGRWYKRRRAHVDVDDEHGSERSDGRRSDMYDVSNDCAPPMSSRPVLSALLGLSYMAKGRAQAWHRQSTGGDRHSIVYGQVETRCDLPTRYFPFGWPASQPDFYRTMDLPYKAGGHSSVERIKDRVVEGHYPLSSLSLHVTRLPQTTFYYPQTSILL